MDENRNHAHYTFFRRESVSSSSAQNPITFQLLSLIIIFATININISALHYLKVSRGLRRVDAGPTRPNGITFKIKFQTFSHHPQPWKKKF